MSAAFAGIQRDARDILERILHVVDCLVGQYLLRNYSHILRRVLQGGGDGADVSRDDDFFHFLRGAFLGGRAVRAYEKAGFQRDRMVDTPDGPALLMVRNP